MPDRFQEWFVRGEGIERTVISENIQLYLGNDATVRPGVGTRGEDKGVNGYVIKAYRNLTSSMIESLQADSRRWRQEQQRRSDTRGSNSPMSQGVVRRSAHNLGAEQYPSSEPYSRSFRDDNARPGPGRESPMREPPFPTGQHQPRDSRNHFQDPMQMDPRPPPDRPVGNRMPPIDPMAPPPDMRYPPPGAQNHPQYPSDGRRYMQDERPYSQDQAMQDAPYQRPPPPGAPYGQDQRYASGYPQPPPPMEAPGFPRQGNYYPGVTSPYEPGPGLAPHGRLESAPFGASPYGAPPPPPPAGPPLGPPPPGPGRDPRDQREPPPRFGQNEFPDPRYPYPSPNTTASSAATPNRESVTSPNAPPSFPPPPPGQYNDQYGRPIQQPGYGPPQGHDPGPPPPSRDQSYGGGGARDRPPPSDYNTSSRDRDRERERDSHRERDTSISDTRDARRRRVR